MSKLSCLCGKVRLTFPEPSPRFRISCLCEDCRQKALWIMSQGGPEVAKAVIDHEEGVDTVYFGNTFTVSFQAAGEDGEPSTYKDHLDFFQLREGCASTSCMTKCCKTQLMVDNTFYNGKCVLIQKDMVKLETDFTPEVAAHPQCYVFPKDFPSDKIASLPPLFEGDTSKDYKHKPGDTAAASSENIQKWVLHNLLPAPEAFIDAGTNSGSTNFQELMKTTGGFAILGLAKGATTDLEKSSMLPALDGSIEGSI
jgi:hypothetical protein